MNEFSMTNRIKGFSEVKINDISIMTITNGQRPII